MITRCAHMSSTESTGDPPNHHLGFFASLRRSHQCCSAVKPRKMASCGRSKAAEAAQERSVKRAGRMLSHSAALRLNQSDAPPWGSGRAAPLRLEHHTNTVAICWPVTQERIDKAPVFLAHPGNWLAGPQTPFSITNNLTVISFDLGNQPW